MCLNSEVSGWGDNVCWARDLGDNCYSYFVYPLGDGTRTEPCFVVMWSKPETKRAPDGG